MFSATAVRSGLYRGTVKWTRIASTISTCWHIYHQRGEEHRICLSLTAARASGISTTSSEIRTASQMISYETWLLWNEAGGLRATLRSPANCTASVILPQTTVLSISIVWTVLFIVFGRSTSAVLSFLLRRFIPLPKTGRADQAATGNFPRNFDVHLCKISSLHVPASGF